MRVKFQKADDLRSDEIILKPGRRFRPDKRKRWPAEYMFSIVRVSDGVKVGHCAFRIGHTEWSFFGGNIGYEVYTPYRGRRYALKACLLLYELARRHGMSYLFITCNPDNPASRRTCELAGGELLAVIDLPTDNSLYNQGERQKCIFRVDLSTANGFEST